MHEEENLPAQCHPIINSKKKKRAEEKHDE